MNELKTRYITDTYLDYFNSGKHDLAQIYLKSEADRYITELEEKHFNELQDAKDSFNSILELNRKTIFHQKYKRCMAMAEMCNARYDEEDAKVNGCGASWEYISKEMKYWERWRWRWDALAEKFKEAK